MTKPDVEHLPSVGEYGAWMRRAAQRAETAGGVSFTDTMLREPSELLSVSVTDAMREPKRLLRAVGGDGNPALIEQLRQRLGAETATILCWTGATAALRGIFEALLSPGDDVVLETPSYPVFGDLVRRMGATSRIYREWMADMTAAGVLKAGSSNCPLLNFPETTSVTDTFGLSEEAWSTAELVLSPGELFGTPGRLRLDLGQCSDELARKLDVLGMFLMGRRHGVQGSARRKS